MPISKVKNKRHQKNRNIINNNVPADKRHAVRYAIAQYQEKLKKKRAEKKLMEVKR